MSSLISELASAAAVEKGVIFEEAMEDRLCAYSRAVAHFPTAVKEVVLLLSYWVLDSNSLCEFYFLSFS